MGNGRYCYPLTVTDHASRLPLLCEAMESTCEDPAVTAFERLFRERGLPNAIRSDNGVPFASPNGLFNLSKLSVWWLHLGVEIERIKPGHPQQNGRHERMHLTLKKEATRPPGMNSLQQQARFDAFVNEFNAERPHEALAMKCPAEVYTPSLRPYAGLPEIAYPFHDRDVLVTACGRLCLHRKRINISTVLSGQRLGIKEVDTKAFGLPASCTMILDISIWSRKPCNPSTTRSARGCHPCLRYDLLPMSPGRTVFLLAERGGFEPPIGLRLCRISSAVLSTAQPPLQATMPLARAFPAAKRQQPSRRTALHSLLFQAVRMRSQNDMVAQIDMMDLAGDAA